MTEVAARPARRYQLRRLTVGDEAVLRGMNAMFGKAFNEPDTYTEAPPDDAYVAALLSKEHVIAMAAFEGTEVVGGLVAYELDKFERARREIYVYDLAVAEAHRREGIAQSLIKRLGELAASRNAWVIYVQADHGDAPAIALYQKLGPREEVMHFDIWMRERVSE